MSMLTSLDDLYTTIGTLVQRETGRKWWRKGGIEVQPIGPYATVYIVEGVGLENEVVEDVVLDEPLQTGEPIVQVPWATTKLDVRVEFFRSGANDSPLQAASRVRSALRLEERFWDLWKIAALAGAVQIIDLSTIFHASPEARAEVRFSINANVALPLPLADAPIHEIDTQQVNVTHVGLDDEEELIEVVIEEDV